MSIETWGQMPKSQEDSELVEAAIARMIAVHEADPAAHLGEGESVEVHRTQEILDHKAGSVLADKWSMSEMDFTTTFESLAGFFISGDVSQIWPGVELDVNVSLGHLLAKLVVDMESSNFVFDTSKSCLIQFPFILDAGDHGLLRIGFGNDGSHDIVGAMGVEITKTTAKFYLVKPDGTGKIYLDFPAYSDYTNYLVRLQNEPSEGVVKCYLDGVLVGTLEWPEQFVGYASIEARLTGSVSGGAVGYLRSLYFSLPIN